MEKRGPCCLVRIHRQPERPCLTRLGKSLSACKVAHVWTEETRFQVALRILRECCGQDPNESYCPRCDLALVAITDSGASRVILPSTALTAKNQRYQNHLTTGSW